MTKSEFSKQFNTIYCWVYRNHPELLEQVFSSKISKRHHRGYWTLDQCIIDAKKYKTRTEWQKHSLSAYSVAHRKGWLNRCCSHMVSVYNRRNYWTLELCLASAKKYPTIKEWSQKDSKAYGAAKRYGWSKICTKHMTLLTHKRRMVVNLDTQKIYQDADTAGIETQICVPNIRSACNGHAKTAGGYRWAYCDENGNVLEAKND